MIFGKGTLLTVEPKSDPTPPSVLLMKSKATSGKQVKAACLAKDFYPKEVKMNFVNSSPVYEQDDPVLSQNGKYNTIKVVQIDDTEDVACSVDYQGKQYSAKATKPAAEQPMTMPTTFCAPSNSTAAEENPEKVNMFYSFSEIRRNELAAF
ncbi:hypothetical protein Y1Q_0010582 [Alligator mississippiensis]|uniref:Ig-like domain-containing protein n=1 Tax=Alligator mississippiensis TaxID=8496 RepID=A0A151PGX9_ALLMI|nr:hypothetical protein Y1Q_0010582 [Alligator mississippiensis]